MINYKSDLNQEQFDIVKHGDGPSLVLAGAGSGKTRAITYRVAYLLEKGVKPDNILLVTFTNKAAKEMVGRVRLLTGGRIKLPWSGTFHHIGYRFLRKYAPLLGYKNNFTILDRQDSLDLIKLCLRQEGIARGRKKFTSPKVLQSVISYACGAESSIEEVLDLKYPDWLDIADVIRRIGSEYGERKKEANIMDFDDLLVNLRLLLLNFESVKNKYSEQFRYVLVDEYQDTNKIQAFIVKQLASRHKNILVVGDDAQSIYSFRAADIQNILSFEREYAGAKIFRLETNYRSTPNILRVANRVILNNKNQYQKKLRSTADSFVKPELRAFADNREEARFIADRILELKDEGAELGGMAVLFRAAFHSQFLEMELAKRGVPYEYRGGVRFFERAHIKDVLAYLKIFNNPKDMVAWKRVLNMQTGIGPAGSEKIISLLRGVNAAPRGYFSTDELGRFCGRLPPKGRIGWNDFMQIYESMVSVAGGKGGARPAGLISTIMNSRYAEYLKNEYPDYRERAQDLKQLSAFAEQQNDLNHFLAEASLHESYTAAQRYEEKGDQREDRLILSTIHQAKGLEWQAVFLINLSAGQFPSDGSLRDNNGLEEERRLFYVAVTRAKKYLYFTYALTGGFGGFTQGPSIFLEEIGRDLLDEHDLGDVTVFQDPSDNIDDVVYIPEERFGGKPRNFLKDIDEL